MVSRSNRRAMEQSDTNLQHERLNRFSFPIAPWFDEQEMSQASPFKNEGESRSKRLAVVIGNADYENENLSPLTNVLNDVVAVKRRLESLGFDIDFKKPLSNINCEGAEIFIYYTGHGCSIERETYLIPVDSDGISYLLIAEELDMIKRIIQYLLSARKDIPIIYILDCCRGLDRCRGYFRVNNIKDACARSLTNYYISKNEKSKHSTRTRDPNKEDLIEALNFIDGNYADAKNNLILLALTSTLEELNKKEQSKENTAGNLYDNQDDYAEHSDTAIALNNPANLYQRNHAKPKSSCQQALVIEEKTGHSH